MQIERNVMNVVLQAFTIWEQGDKKRNIFKSL
jgi:hypothetical protein